VSIFSVFNVGLTGGTTSKVEFTIGGIGGRIGLTTTTAGTILTTAGTVGTVGFTIGVLWTLLNLPDLNGNTTLMVNIYIILHILHSDSHKID